jgi:hypothetical protein
MKLLFAQALARFELEESIEHDVLWQSSTALTSVKLSRTTKATKLVFKSTWFKQNNVHIFLQFKFSIIYSNDYAEAIKMNGTSNVGNSQVYEDGDQKNLSRSEIEQEKKDNRFHEGKENSHKANDSSE